MIEGMTMSNIEDWVRTAMDQMTARLDKLGNQMEDVRERLIRMEASTVHTAVEELKSQLAAQVVKIDALEAARDLQTGTVQGVSKAYDVVIKLAPWVFATGVVVLTNWQKLFG